MFCILLGLLYPQGTWASSENQYENLEKWRNLTLVKSVGRSFWLFSKSSFVKLHSKDDRLKEHKKLHRTILRSSKEVCSADRGDCLKKAKILSGRPNNNSLRKKPQISFNKFRTM